MQGSSAATFYSGQPNKQPWEAAMISLVYLGWVWQIGSVSN